ncbi:MAG: PhoU family transcriptional regulator [Ktedonobacteraceae bacterium]|nr:PhoU family transcriptional regulator [Ktedonobacteraceae bacterium]
MTRTILDKELSELNAQLTRLGSTGCEALKKALEAFETGDLAKCGMVIEMDPLIDSMRTAVEEHAIRLLTMQQPLGGRDLRLLTCMLSIASELERIGDNATAVAQIMLRMTPLRGTSMPHVQIESVPHIEGQETIQITEAAIINSMLELGREALRVFEGTVKALTEYNASAARYICEEDDVVDVRYHLVRHDLMAMMSGARAIPALKNDSLILQRATYLLWIAHKLERVADHCTNICERIVFIVEGENMVRA